MNKHNSFQEDLTYFQSVNGEELQIDQVGLSRAYDIQRHDQSIAVKIISVLGGGLATLAFMGFLFIANLFDSEFGLITSGIIFFGLSIFIHKVTDAIILDSISICLFLMGLLLFGLGLDKSNIELPTIATSIMVLSLLAILISKSYMINFSAVITAISAFAYLLVEISKMESIYLTLVLMGMASVFFLLNEGKLLKLSKWMAARYLPIRTALCFVFVTSLQQISYLQYDLDYSNLPLITSVIFIVMTLLSLNTMLQSRNYGSLTQRLCILLVVALSLGFTIFSPAISGAMLILLICFQTNYKTGFVLGLLAFIFFLGKFYYDLQITLLTKSLFMMGSGVVFLGLYFFTHKKLERHEKL